MSKGGNSSTSAAAQSADQWAAAQANSTIDAWREGDILGTSLERLQALSTAQLARVQVPWALPGAVLTVDKINSIPWKYWQSLGARYLVTTTNGVRTVQKNQPDLHHHCGGYHQFWAN